MDPDLVEKMLNSDTDSSEVDVEALVSDNISETLKNEDLVGSLEPFDTEPVNSSDLLDEISSEKNEKNAISEEYPDELSQPTSTTSEQILNPDDLTDTSTIDAEKLDPDDISEASKDEDLISSSETLVTEPTRNSNFFDKILNRFRKKEEGASTGEYLNELSQTDSGIVANPDDLDALSKIDTEAMEPDDISEASKSEELMDSLKSPDTQPARKSNFLDKILNRFRKKKPFAEGDSNALLQTEEATEDLITSSEDSTSSPESSTDQDAFAAMSALLGNSDEATEETEVSPEQMAKLNQAFEKLDQNQDLDGMFNEAESLADSKSLDAQIAEALERDAMSSQDTAVDGEIRDFINDVAVYDAQGEDSDISFETPTSSTSKIMGKINSIPPKTLMIIVGVIGGFIILLIALAAGMVISNIGTNKEIDENTSIISQPAGATNNANFIYVSSTAEIDGRSFTILKLLLDPNATVFYFDKYFNPLEYDIRLIDENDNIYNMDYTYLDNPLDDTHFKPTILNFKPLSNKIRRFSLNIYNPTTGEVAEYKFALNHAISYPSVKYVINAKELVTNTDSLSLEINNLSFSSAGSKVNFAMSWLSDNSKLQLGRPGNDSVGISMQEGVRTLLPLRSSVNQYTFDNYSTIIGTMDFAPVRDLKSKVKIVFNDLFKEYTINEDIPIRELSPNADGEAVRVLQLENQKLEIERAFPYSSLYVMVLHTEDLSVYGISGADGASNNRLETLLDVELIALKNDGTEVVIPGKCTSSNIGTDILFDMGSYTKFFENTTPPNVFFRIKSALIKVHNLETTFNLSEGRNSQTLQITKTLSAINQAFEQRLAYKSGELSFDSIQGFAPEILSNSALMQAYDPITASENAKPQYSTQILNHISKDEQVFAVVQETWILENSPPLYRTHKVCLELVNGNWLITEDEITP